MQRVDAAYPAEALSERREGRVELYVTVAADGSVSQVELASSAGASFDAAALDALKQWRFQPARRGQQAIVARIRVPVVFTLPRAEAEDTTPPPTAAEALHSGAAAGASSEGPAFQSTSGQQARQRASAQGPAQPPTGIARFIGNTPSRASR